jgi:hypothetical protein
VNFPELLLATIINSKTKSGVNILKDTGGSLAACPRSFVEEHNLPIEKSDHIYEIEGVTNDTILSNEFTTFKIHL